MKKILSTLILMTVLLSACAGANSLDGTKWALVSYGPAENQTSAIPDIFAYIYFNTEGNIEGKVGCNSFSGAYEVSGKTLTTGPLMSTLMGCESPIMEQETAVMMLLNGELPFEIDGENLTITSEDGNSELHLVHTEN
ncbi:MAG: META domain-containing protein [Chloroflexota bacterium]